MYILRGHRLSFPKNIVFHSLKIAFVLANNADPDEMPPHAAGISSGFSKFAKEAVL